MNRLPLFLALAVGTGINGLAIAADMSGHDQHHAQMTGAGPQSAATVDGRLLVTYPEPLRVQTLANMRDHLSTMGAIQDALARGSFDQASELAERRLGMSSLDMHGAHEVAMYMPKGMQDAGTMMHRTASRFAITAKDASATGDLRPVLAALANLNLTCVACHAAYRIQ
jgi:membrane protease subunit (stomatin/prohibitin family)